MDSIYVKNVQVHNREVGEDSLCIQRKLPKRFRNYTFLPC